MEKLSPKAELLQKVDSLMKEIDNVLPSFNSYANGIGFYIYKSNLVRLKQYQTYLEIEREIYVSEFTDDEIIFDAFYDQMIALVNEGIELVTKEQYADKKSIFKVV